MWITWRQIKELADRNTKMTLEQNFKLIPVLHHLTAGLKSLITEYAYKGIDELRQACGGAGFSLASGIADIFMDFSPNPTYEGVNVVLS